MPHPKAIGDRSTLAIILGLTETGREVFLPFGENSRTDLVIADLAGLARVQCKTGRLRSGVIRFKVCSSYAHHSNPASLARPYLDEVEFFAIYCPETTGVYLIPIDDIQLRWQGALRVSAPLNGQRRGIRLAADYEVARVAVSTAGLAASAGA